MGRHWAQLGDVADDHRMECYCKESGLSYCEGGHSWSLELKAVERWVVLGPKVVLMSTECHEGR